MHIDIPDLMKSWDYDVADFFSKRKNIPVTYDMLKNSEIDLLGFSLYRDKSFICNDFYTGVKEFYNVLKEIINESNGSIIQVRSYSDIKNKSKKKIGVIPTIEGFECFRSIDDFFEFYELGVRIFGPTWDNNNQYATSRNSDGGLTEMGRNLVKLMNSRDLIIDTAHLGKKSTNDIFEIFDGVIVNTHSNVKSVCYESHNLDDEEIQNIVEREGLVCLIPLIKEVGGVGNINDFRKHIDYIGDKWGIEFVGISSDIYPLEEYPFMWNEKRIDTLMKRLENELIDHYSKKTLEMIFRENWIRVLDNAL